MKAITVYLLAWYSSSSQTPCDMTFQCLSVMLPSLSPRHNPTMASLESKLRGDKKENYVGDSDSDNDTFDENAPPPGIKTPVSDGLPQVSVWCRV